jgi:ATP-dependent DNA helicase RecG
MYNIREGRFAYMQLTDILTRHFRLNELQKKALEKLGISTVRDLLYHFPSRYEDIASIKTVSSLTLGTDAIIFGKVGGLSTRKSFHKKTPIAEGWLQDHTGKIKLIWFHQPYLAKMLTEGTPVKLAGRVTGANKKLYIANPEIERVKTLPIDSHDSLFANGKERTTFFAIYPESQGITSLWFRHALLKILKLYASSKSVYDPIPQDILTQYHLPDLYTALIWIHTPKHESDSRVARKRFAFEEVFLVQLSHQRARKLREQKPSLAIRVDRARIKEFVSRFPFPLTDAQQKSIEEILHDFETPNAMARLLEGDVGSGKTAVAASTIYAATMTPPSNNRFGTVQTAYMVPTEILAKQHFASFIHLFEHLPIQIGLITSSGCKKFPSKTNSKESTSISRAQLLKWVASGDIAILLGTHALIQKTVQFQNLALVVIDEQHRFGTAQRQMLTRKDAIIPHLLSMSATPIPRTLALTIYGDLDITVLDQMPKGRKPVKTEIVLPDKREEMYEKVKKELDEGRQAYIICPRVDEPNPTKEMSLNAKSVKEEAARLKRGVFKKYFIDILYGKMKPKDKEGVMERFEKGKIDILVATSVVEVGVNVPNATVIVIEGAERFGLAQLHQLRGRVIRSTHQAHCFVYAETTGANTLKRLKALTTAKNGFELAEFDLGIRGAGELAGLHQHGITDIGMEAIKNVKMVEAARNEARNIIDQNLLATLPRLQTLVNEKSKRLHFE